MFGPRLSITILVGVLFTAISMSCVHSVDASGFAGDHLGRVDHRRPPVVPALSCLDSGSGWAGGSRRATSLRPDPWTICLLCGRLERVWALLDRRPVTAGT